MESSTDDKPITQDLQTKQRNTMHVNGEEVEPMPSSLVKHPVEHKNTKQIYWIGYSLRIVGLLGLSYALIISLPTGPYFFLYMLGLATITLPSVLAIAVGHYLASNWKPKS